MYNTFRLDILTFDLSLKINLNNDSFNLYTYSNFSLILILQFLIEKIKNNNVDTFKKNFHLVESRYIWN